MKATTEQKRQRGIQYWMERVIEESASVRAGFQADPVHDLRVALRRCRSMAEGFRAIDPDPRWIKMRKAAKAVFAALGELRDVQVLMEWIQKLSGENDPVASRLMDHCTAREAKLKVEAAEALAEFDSQQWLAWATELQRRSDQVSASTEVFQVLALEKWAEARQLHRTALRNRSKLAWHSLRIGVKRFRYVVENFLPELHSRWGDDLKHIQDALGEVHDLDVLLDTAHRVHAFVTPQEQQRWRARIGGERSARLNEYRSKMIGRNSLWQQWRAELPDGEKLRRAVLKKFEVWAGFLDPDPAHTRHVLALTLKLYDALLEAGLFNNDLFEGVAERDLLAVAVCAHEVGRAAQRGNHQKKARRMLEKVDVPPDWSQLHLHIAGLIARYHTGALPSRAQRSYAGLPEPARGVVDRLAGVLRLSDALDKNHDQLIHRIQVQRSDGLLRIYADGYSDRTRNAEQIAAARHLLESICGLPIIVAPTAGQ